MTRPDEIIVLVRFDTLIEANIVKTKMDAYGIPCYLTEENLTSLTTHLLSGGIRLHIFARDEARARQVMFPGALVESEEDGLLECPRCRSRKVIRQHADNLHSRFTRWIFRTFLGLSKPLYCLNCGHEFQG